MLGKEASAHNFKVTSRYFADRKIRKMRDMYFKKMKKTSLLSKFELQITVILDQTIETEETLECFSSSDSSSIISIVLGNKFQYLIK